MTKRINSRQGPYPRCSNSQACNDHEKSCILNLCAKSDHRLHIRFVNIQRKPSLRCEIPSSYLKNRNCRNCLNLRLLKSS